MSKSTHRAASIRVRCSRARPTSKQLGVDCIDIGDSPMARVRMSCIALAALCEQRIGIETMIHFTTRDRNLMALQSSCSGRTRSAFATSSR